MWTAELRTRDLSSAASRAGRLLACGARVWWPRVSRRRAWKVAQPTPSKRIEVCTDERMRALAACVCCPPRLCARTTDNASLAERCRGCAQRTATPHASARTQRKEGRSCGERRSGSARRARPLLTLFPSVTIPEADEGRLRRVVTKVLILAKNRGARGPKIAWGGVI